MGANPAFEQAAVTLGGLLAERGLKLVYGGGNIGLMGVVADAAMSAGGEVMGVIPRALADKELAHHGVTELRVVRSMHERKALMADCADAFIAMPGGYGTLEELCEVITWSQLGMHNKPCGLLNVAGYYDALLRQFDDGVSGRFIRPQHRAIVLSAADPESLLEKLSAQRLPRAEKWIEKDET
ncbi:MAG: TIGR00730 family Rossman fold protein [Pirellulaceae bacterium]|jgi:hypothetical protein|nr:TIGR00730 family Rossman fold protein [Pirellulaceae bacterium]